MFKLSKKSALALLCVGVLSQTTALAGELPKTGQYDKTSVVYAEGTGATFEEAKQRAFRSAIQEAVGVLNISEQAVDGDRLAKDQINEYSAGYIDDYEILESHEDSQRRVTVSLQARVASSKIAQRMISRGDKTSQVQGQMLLTKLESQLNVRNSGDALLSEVLSSYPQNAFVINQGASEVKISPTRQPYMFVPYEVTMSKFWVDGLNEALTAVSASNNSCNTIALSISNNQQQPGAQSIAQKFCGDTEPDVRIFSGSGFFGSTASSYKFHDVQTLAMFNKHLLNSTKPQSQGTIAMQVEFINNTGVVSTKCTLITVSELIGYNEPTYNVEYNSNLNRQYMRPVIDSRAVAKRNLRINITDWDSMADVIKVRLSMQKSCN